jgi:hypothetical protein
MLRRMTRVLLGGGVVLAAVVGSVAPGGVAGATSGSGAVRPHQTFVGLVNGSQTGAKVKVACSEAVRPGERGNPVSGQTIAVRSPAPSSASSGATGSSGRRIVAQFSTSSTAAAPDVVFTSYGSQPIPTTLLLPCMGSGTVVFAPRPTSATARSVTLTVTFVSPCPGVCAGHRRLR